MLPTLIQEKIIYYCTDQMMYDLSRVNYMFRSCFLPKWLIRKNSGRAKYERESITLYFNTLARIRAFDGTPLIKYYTRHKGIADGFDFNDDMNNPILQNFLDHNLRIIDKMNDHQVSALYQLISLSNCDKVKVYDQTCPIIMSSRYVCFDQNDNLVILSLK